jgi:hypothetical protein
MLLEPSRLPEEHSMPNIFAVASLAAAVALSAPAALAQTDTSGGTMSDKTMSGTMAPKKPMMKHHPMHKKPMTMTKMKSDTMKSGDTQQKM